MSVRPEFGPTLPELLAVRGVSRRAMAIGAVVLVLAAAGAWLLVAAVRDTQQLTADGPPQFNLEYAQSALGRKDPREGELARLEGRRRDVTAEITVRPVTLPGYERANVIGGYLPLLAERRIHELEQLYGPIDVRDEGKARINRLPGYQIGFSAKTPEGALFGRDAYVFPDDARARQGVLLSLRRVIRRKQTAADADWFDQVKQAFSSFFFGSGRP